jgi:hypothetical protein
MRHFSQMLLAGTLIFAAAAAAGDLDRVASTQTIPFANTGTLRLENPSGTIYIYGWDRTDVEVTFAKSTYNPKDHAKLDRVVSKAERRGDEVVISSVKPRWADIQIEYEIHAPRHLALAIEHGKGGVYVTGMDGDIQAKVRDGQITLRLPENGKYAIDSRATIGHIYSDFGGSGKTNIHFGERLTNSADGAHKLNLEIGFGDILILKTPYHPEQPLTPTF